MHAETNKEISTGYGIGLSRNIIDVKAYSGIILDNHFDLPTSYINAVQQDPERRRVRFLLSGSNFQLPTDAGAFQE